MDHLTQQTTDITHLELFLEASEFFTWDHLRQSLYLDRESCSSNVSHTTRYQLTESIVNEHIRGLGIGGRCRSSHAVFDVMRVLSYQCLDHEIPLLTRNSYTLTVFSALIISNMESRRMKVPVRPTPALQWTNRVTPLSLLWAFCTLLMKEMREVANLGTPWSGQEVKCDTVSLPEVSHLGGWSGRKQACGVE